MIGPRPLLIERAQTSDGLRERHAGLAPSEHSADAHAKQDCQETSEQAQPPCREKRTPLGSVLRCWGRVNAPGRQP